MDKDPEIGVKAPAKQRGKPFTKNDPRINRKGRATGLRDFNTDFDEVVEEIAEENHITRSEARKHLLKVAYKHAKEGSFPFWNQLVERQYGKVDENHNIKGNLVVEISETIAKKNDTNP